MAISIDVFKNLADSSWRDGRKLVVRGEGDQATARLGSFVFSPGKAENNATMKAFKAALETEYGVFGTHAFDSFLATRNMREKGLRVGDVKKVMSGIHAIRENRLRGEIMRQLDASPKILALKGEDAEAVRRFIEEDVFKGVRVDNLVLQDDVVNAARRRIDAAIDELLNRNGALEKQALGPRMLVEAAAADNEATGLKDLDVRMAGDSTSVGDKIKSGELGVGMTASRTKTSAMLFLGLKTSGVEPGFTYRNDWTADDTLGMMSAVDSDESVDELNALLQRNPDLAGRCAGEGKTLRDKIMLAGRAHHSGMAAVAEFAIEEAAKLVKSGVDLDASDHPFARLAKALKSHFQSAADVNGLANMTNVKNRQALAKILNEAKEELFPHIRDAVANVPKGHAFDALSPIFAHFRSKHILKLDYNEGDRFVQSLAAHKGSFQRPERYLAKHGSVMRYATSASADSISASAVAEALANDLTRLAGVPAQELEIVRGQYSDGHPKLMVQAKFSDGYKDMDKGFIQDGRIVGGNVESLGKYKAFFLLLADRDAVGKYGQNKGFVPGKDGGGARFFAIDPGHSLEGESKNLRISDDLSFKDTSFKRHIDKRFANFSAFDDDTRFSKIKGLVDIRELWNRGVFTNLFSDYRARFNPREEGISSAERNLRTRITELIDRKEAEFRASYQNLVRACEAPLALYDALQGDGPEMQENAINAVSHLEMLTSPTTWTSRHDEVRLKHLEVTPGTRVRWTATVDGGNIVFKCDKALDRRIRDRLQEVADMKPGVEFQYDRRRKTQTLTVPKDLAADFFALFSEDYVQQTKHPFEYMSRNAR